MTTTICTCSSNQFPGNHHCPGCCRSFTGETAFHAHLQVERSRVVAHHNPADVGLVQRPDGRWGHPPPDNGFDWSQLRGSGAA